MKEISHNRNTKNMETVKKKICNGNNMETSAKTCKLKEFQKEEINGGVKTVKESTC